MKIKKLSLITVFALLIVAFCCLPIVAAAEQFTTNTAIFDDVVLGVGTDETQRNVNWYSTANVAGSIDYAPAASMVSGSFSTEYKTARATIKSAKVKTGYYVNSATITDLEENTEYVYRLRVGTLVSVLYYFNTGSFGDYEFIFAGDPQVSDQTYGNEWADTLRKAISNFSNAELLISAGDLVDSRQSEVGTAIAEEHWSCFLVDELAEVSFAATVGPGHDVKIKDDVASSFGEHFNLPNQSDKYAVTQSLADYWYVYNNTLFMHLNMSDKDAVDGEHKEFIKETMQQNPNVNWNIVVMHHSLFTTGSHSSPSYEYYEGEIKRYRNALAPQLTELGIDIVLSGHDHIYVRSKMMDGLGVSDDIVVNNSVTDPEGTLYICATSSTGSKFYSSQVSGDDAYYVEKESGEERKSIIRFAVTDSSITLNSYYVDTSEPELFDTFTIYKTPHEHSPELIEEQKATCTADGNNAYWYCEGCDRYFIDENCSVTTTPDAQITEMTGHRWNDATCTSPRACRNDGCTATQGKARGHNASEPTCTEPSVCKRCDETVSEALGHEFSNACDTSCNREDCTYTRTAAAHIDADANLLCDECGLAIDPPSNAGNKENGAVVIIIIACVGGAVVVGGAVTTVILMKKKRRK